MTLESITAIAMALFAVVGALSALCTLVGNMLPAESKFGQLLRKFGADLKPQLPALPAPEAPKKQVVP